MLKVDISPSVFVLADKGGIGKSFVARLIALELSAIDHGDVRTASGRGWTDVPSGPRRRGTKKRRD